MRKHEDEPEKKIECAFILQKFKTLKMNDPVVWSGAFDPNLVKKNLIIHGQSAIPLY